MSIEVAEFGEEEVRFRRNQEYKAMKEQDELFTFELKELDIQEQLAYLDIIVSTHIRVNEELVIQDAIPKTQLQEFDFAEYEQHLIGEIDKKDENTNRWKIEKLFKSY